MVDSAPEEAPCFGCAADAMDHTCGFSGLSGYYRDHKSRKPTTPPAKTTGDNRG